MKITAQQLATACGARLSRAQACVDALNEAMAFFEINSPVRVGMFLANIGHETMGLQYLKEIWGPTKQQLRYERDFAAPWPKNAEEARRPAFAKNRLAYNLGNVQKGDGSKFPGRGLIHTTGRYNHAATRDRLRKRLPTPIVVPDFEMHPEELSDPYWAAWSACDYVDMKGCNKMADAGDFDGYCDLVNRGRKTEDEGDSNGWAHRLALWQGIQRQEIFG